jgi:hypothetical protein
MNGMRSRVALLLLGAMSACSQPGGEADRNEGSNMEALGNDALILNDAAAANSAEPLAAEPVPVPEPVPPTAAPSSPAPKVAPKVPPKSPPADPVPPPDPHSGHDMANMSEAEARNMSD